jgi:TolA-binding protein
MPKHVFAMAAFIALLPFGAAAQPMVQSQEGIALENQILQLQAQVQQLQAGGAGGSALGGGGGGAPPPDNGGNGGAAVPSSVLTNLLTQVQQLQSQVQDLNGRVDTLQNQVNTQNAAMAKAIGDIKFAMGNAAPGATPGQGAAPGTPTGPNAAPQKLPQNLNPVPPPAHTAAVPASPKEALHTAQTAILKRDFPTAEAAARGILATSKTSPQGYQAQYILAQSLYGEGKAQDSAIAFDDAYNRDRSGAYAPGSLLGLANSLSAIHQEAAACDTLASLNSQFPTPPKGMEGAIAAASKRAHCG